MYYHCRFPTTLYTQYNSLDRLHKTMSYSIYWHFIEINKFEHITRGYQEPVITEMKDRLLQHFFKFFAIYSVSLAVIVFKLLHKMLSKIVIKGQ